MATNFIFPKAPRVGDRIEIVSISEEKLPINLIGNAEAEKNLSLVFPDQTFSGNADGETAITTIEEKNIVYTFKCVSTKDVHMWLLESSALYSKIKALEERIAALEAKAG